MSRRVLLSAMFCLVLGVLLVFPVSSLEFGVANSEARSVGQSDGLRVHNLNTTRSYSTIQEAINAVETLGGHVISVDSGVYRERVSVNKSLSIVGQDRSSTIIDGFGGTVVHVTSNDTEIRDLTVRNGTFGILVERSEDVRLVGNVVSEGSYGIRIYHSKNVQVVGNRVSGFRFFGIELDSSGNSFLRNNQMMSNRYNFGVDGNSLTDFLNDIDESNTVNGKAVRYLINQRGLVVDSSGFEDVGFIGLVNSTRITVEELDVRNNKQGLLFAFVTDSSIVGVNAVDNWNGVYVAHSKNVSVSWVTANYNFDYGIKFFNSSRSVAISNNVDSNGWGGIGLFKSSGSLLDKNEANFNSYNLHIVFTNNSVITRNNASGLSPEKPGSYSIAVYYSHNSRIFHNAFSTTLLFVESRNGSRIVPKNKWDNGVEGNYWLYYGGRDSNLDGIGDTVYRVGENNTDSFPLKGRFWDFIVLLGGRLHSLTLISNSSAARLDWNATGTRISLAVSGRNGTLGFSRVALPKGFVQSIELGSLNFVIDGLKPTLVRNWSDSVYYYWYFSYIHSAAPLPETSDSWLIYAFGVSALLLSAGLVIFIALRKRRARLK